ncbi:hypothetical protein HUJ04_008313 [Dendroctonus ponderosae]|nr:hypothetical protein HUJ04_008313 [Dendroctonus ponderosae]
MKILRRRLNLVKRNIWKLADKHRNIVTSREELLIVVTDFYSELYSNQAEPLNQQQLPKVQNVGSEDIPQIIIDEIKSAVKNMKNNKSAGDDDVTIEYIKEGGSTLLYVIQKLFNACLVKGTTPSQWTNAVIIIMHKKRGHRSEELSTNKPTVPRIQAIHGSYYKEAHQQTSQLPTL